MNKLNKYYSGNNQLTELSNLPNALNTLYCIFNQLTKPSDLPNTLNYLYCYQNRLLFIDIKSLRKLDNFIIFFNLNRLLQVMFLYSVMKRLESSNLPSTLTTLYCGSNQLTVTKCTNRSIP